MATTPKHVAAN